MVIKYKTIKIKKYSDVIEEFVVADGKTITPGMVVKVNASGKVEPGYGGLLMVALEDELQGGGIDDTYAAGQPVQVWIPYRGDMFYAIPSGTTNPVAGDLVEAGSDSGGAGKVVKHTVGTSTGDVLGQVVQVVTTTVPGENNRVVVRVF